ncbi:TPT domain-containing protein [Mucor velutinosus]|uniref:TPT domain-containing protein n=1 Tax=Mucor velutinosus TaxID=708070 RepID=A0AAN7HZZ7_9FUNG|nr:TPT domain-containing protein [Mucor velutinosus]
MRRSRAWSARGTQAVIESPSARAVSHTVIGAVSAIGVVNVSLRDPGNVKERKVVGAKKRKAPGNNGSAIPKGTTSGHCLQFISDTLDIMDEFPNMKGYHIVMDNVPIHSPAIVDPVIVERGYIPVYLPPYSPELKPIEMFWKVLKDRVRRGKLNNVETLTSRIIEGSEDIPVEHLQHFIQHSIDCFPKCLNKEPLQFI